MMDGSARCPQESAGSTSSNARSAQDGVRSFHLSLLKRMAVVSALLLPPYLRKKRPRPRRQPPDGSQLRSNRRSSTSGATCPNGIAMLGAWMRKSLSCAARIGSAHLKNVHRGNIETQSSVLDANAEKKSS